MKEEFKKPVIVGITGASGAIYWIRTIQHLLTNNYKLELVFSDSAIKVAKEELGLELSSIPEIIKKQVLSYFNSQNISFNSENLNVWAFNDISASISSGSYKTAGMIIIPASMGTIASIASGTSQNLITRAADVCLKERRKIVVVPREMPLSSIHLENMLKLSTNGVIISPACPGFYSKPKEINQLVDFVIGKVFDLFGIEHTLFTRWNKEKVCI